MANRLYPTKNAIEKNSQSLSRENPKLVKQIKLRDQKAAVGLHLLAALFSKELSLEADKLSMFDHNQALKKEHVEAAVKIVLPKFSYRKAVLSTIGDREKNTNNTSNAHNSSQNHETESDSNNDS